jgi:predicted ester cyclase
MAVPATGRRVEVAGIGIDRLAGGKLVESWVNLDVLGLLLQLGVVPSLPPPT